MTVEAKLRDWRQALNQARRQAFSADASYIALEASACRQVAPDLARIAADGIGVIAVDPNSYTAQVLVRPHRLSRSRTVTGRALVAERGLEMLSRGTRQGQIYPVFGWTLPSAQ